MTDANADEHQAVLAATQALLAPLARLLVARGVPFASIEESLKAALVEAARAAHPDGLPHRLVSRIATATGINRREVTRLTLAADQPVPAPRSIASELFARWRTAPAWRDARGRPRVLPRQGEAPSFEALARELTQDVHPRSLLDELVRLGIATHDPVRDTVALALEDFVPSADRARMLDFLADNVGDHLAAAVENVLGPAPTHLERAVFAHGLSPESVATAQAWVEQTWQRLLSDLVPFLERLIAEDDADPRRAMERRFRVGLYAYAETGTAPIGPTPAKRTASRKTAPGSAASRTAPTPRKKRGRPGVT